MQEVEGFSVELHTVLGNAMKRQKGRLDAKFKESETYTRGLSIMKPWILRNSFYRLYGVEQMPDNVKEYAKEMSFLTVLNDFNLFSLIVFLIFASIFDYKILYSRQHTFFKLSIYISLGFMLFIVFAAQYHVYRHSLNNLSINWEGESGYKQVFLLGVGLALSNSYYVVGGCVVLLVVRGGLVLGLMDEKHLHRD